MCAKIAVCLSGLVNKPCRLWIGWFLSRSSLPCRVLLILFFLQQLTARLRKESKPSHQLFMWFSSQSHIPLLEYFPHSYKLKPRRSQPPWAILTWSTTPPTRRMAMRWKSKGLVSQPRWGFFARERYGAPRIVPTDTGIIVRYESSYNFDTHEWAESTVPHEPGTAFV